MLAVPLGQSMKNKARKMSLAWNIKSMRNLLLEIYGLFKQNYPALAPIPTPRNNFGEEQYNFFS